MWQIPLNLATPLAKVILDKLYEGVGSKLGEKVVEVATTPIQKLGQVVWEWCFQGKPNAEKLLEAAAQGSAPEVEQVRVAVLKELNNSDFVKEIQPIAQEIYQVIVQIEQINAKNIQQIFGGQGVMITEKQEQPIINIQGGSPTFNIGTQKH